MAMVIAPEYDGSRDGRNSEEEIEERLTCEWCGQHVDDCECEEQ